MQTMTEAAETSRLCFLCNGSNGPWRENKNVQHSEQCIFGVLMRILRDGDSSALVLARIPGPTKTGGGHLCDACYLLVMQADQLQSQLDRTKTDIREKFCEGWDSVSTGNGQEDVSLTTQAVLPKNSGSSRTSQPAPQKPEAKPKEQDVKTTAEFAAPRRSARGRKPKEFSYGVVTIRKRSRANVVTNGKEKAHAASYTKTIPGVRSKPQASSGRSPRNVFADVPEVTSSSIPSLSHPETRNAVNASSSVDDSKDELVEPAPRQRRSERARKSKRKPENLPLELSSDEDDMPAVAGMNDYDGGDDDCASPSESAEDEASDPDFIVKERESEDADCAEVRRPCNDLAFATRRQKRPRGDTQNRAALKPARGESQVCEECGLSGTHDMLELHRHLVHGAKTGNFPCELCPAMLHSEQALDAHRKRHHVSPDPEKVFVCEHCGRKCRSEYERKNHQEVVHAGECKYACSECGEKFRYKPVLRNHLLRAHGIDKRSGLPCNICEKVFHGSWKSQMFTFHMKDAHQIEVPALKTWRCKTCNKEFQFKSRLINHERLHTGEKPHVCSHCGKTFRLQQKLSIHIGRMHSGRKRAEKPAPAPTPTPAPTPIANKPYKLPSPRPHHHHHQLSQPQQQQQQHRISYVTTTANRPHVVKTSVAVNTMPLGPDDEDEDDDGGVRADFSGIPVGSNIIVEMKKEEVQDGQEQVLVQELAGHHHLVTEHDLMAHHTLEDLHHIVVAPVQVPVIAPGTLTDDDDDGDDVHPGYVMIKSEPGVSCSSVPVSAIPVTVTESLVCSGDEKRLAFGKAIWTGPLKQIPLLNGAPSLVVVKMDGSPVDASVTLYSEMQAGPDGTSSTLHYELQ